MDAPYFKLYEILDIVDRALDEDIKTGDLTTNLLIPEDRMASAFIVAKEDGIIAGLPVAEIVFKKINEDIEFVFLAEDGEKINRGDKLAEIKGSFRAILTGERLALNLLQRMSGIATETSKYVDAIKDLNTKLLDTRKTAPGLRILDKYAVKAGGGTNHRIGLYDMVMIKDNHIEVAGSITRAVENIKKHIRPEIKIEVETKNLDEVREAINAEVDVIMLDNMDNETMQQAVKIIASRCKTEASGNITLARIRSVAETGVDFISVGAVTHSVIALDISLYIEPQKF